MNWGWDSVNSKTGYSTRLSVRLPVLVPSRLTTRSASAATTDCMVFGLFVAIVKPQVLGFSYYRYLYYEYAFPTQFSPARRKNLASIAASALMRTCKWREWVLYQQYYRQYFYFPSHPHSYALLLVLVLVLDYEYFTQQVHVPGTHCVHTVLACKHDNNPVLEYQLLWREREFTSYFFKL